MRPAARTLVAGALAAGLAATSAAAQSVEENVLAAINAAADANSAHSREAMRKAAADLWLQTPFTVAKAVFVSNPAPALGDFEARPDATFAEGEALRVYAEPVSYGWKKDGAYFVTDLVVDAALISDGGQTLWEKKEFGRFNLRSRYRLMEFVLNLKLDITGLTPGSYVLEYRVTDEVRNQSDTISLSFTGK